MNSSVLETWTRGDGQLAGPQLVGSAPLVTSVRPDASHRSIPFIGLVEATVVQAFRRIQLPTARIRRALQALAGGSASLTLTGGSGSFERSASRVHPLASRQILVAGADALRDYAVRSGDGQIRLLTVVSSGHTAFHDVIDDYLVRVLFEDDDPWATSLIVPVTTKPVLRVSPGVADGDPIFINGGAPLSAVRSRWRAGEPIASIDDYGVPVDDMNEAIDALWPDHVAA